MRPPNRAGKVGPAPGGNRRDELRKARDYEGTVATIQTTQGEMTVRFFWKEAPGHVKNFVDLAEAGFYDGTIFHRVIPGFMIQGGDPQTKDAKVSPSRYGTGGNTDAAGREVRVKAEFSTLSHRRGILSMARSSDPDSASSQFFVVVKDSPFLDRQYTVFGEVVSGIEVADRIVSESKPNLADPSGGRPTAYQKITGIALSE